MLMVPAQSNSSKELVPDSLFMMVLLESIFISFATEARSASGSSCEFRLLMFSRIPELIEDAWLEAPTSSRSKTRQRLPRRAR
jgi:hypothetical protein